MFSQALLFASRSLIFKNSKYMIQDKSFSQKLFFHSSPPRRAIPPIIALVLTPIARIGAFLFGRNFRKWWKNLPPETRALYISRLRKQKNYFLGTATSVSIAVDAKPEKTKNKTEPLLWGWNSHGLFGALTTGGIAFYFTHLEEAPVTGRRRFVFVSEKSLLEISKFEFESFLVQFGSKALPPHHSIYKKVTAIANRILEANKDIEEIYHKQWSVTVFDQPDIANAAVLPSGAILVFSGLLDRCANEDEFAFVLAHELSHCIVGHNAELYSRTSVLNAIKIVLMGVCMALLPTDMTGILSYLFGSGTLTAAFELPYGRELEREADEVGLTLVARACYDTRYGAVFWEKMRLLEDIEMGIEIPDWISTHPANATRRDHLKGLEGSAAAVREVCKCPPLSDVDIEKEVEDFVRAVKEKHEKDRPVVLLQLPKRPVPSI